ncbi:glycoside hydrolase family 5 protein [Phanerochaete carnosa HHB-10118-sp]|uniref:mannan endo-1,4-beta-mannosidase n=1 Tax=Phanerochaete carnosa (strain HHB-10118-sp) TaxID=650164 RepID=K5WCR5_PHACS|nr:glycoside hydrolase family 5 protein [Phanerochaete carnosa HHB-10118-sp]EKM61758.1 glycoside hydrolase family 5 protein [Phanerochaete carnosa HHB-10118-sp]
MLKVGFLALAFALSPLVQAQVAVWGQCGGIDYTGSTTCAAGSVCVEQNDYYSQCIPGATASTTITSASSHTASSASSSVVSSSTSAAPPPASTGFVKTSGQKFVLNGEEFTVVGENSYWVGLMGYGTADISKAFQDIAGAGSTTVRTWGFNEVTSSTQANSPIYYQSWSGSTPTVNTGASGLENFDTIVSTAKANGLRLIVALTNNWSDYGGMDVYTQQILGSADHDLFYTNAQVIAAYKNYIKTFVGRYVNEPTILGWELANEPRCAGSTGTTSGTCTTATVTNWISEISAYIKSIDPNHLVALGDEGFFNEPGNPSYPYQGGEGIDFNVNLNISTIDFGTFHLYPDSWGQSSDPSDSVWGSQWISDHATSQKSANKPVIMEEFGVTNNQTGVYTTWYSTVISSGLTGDLIWQAGSELSNGDTPNDGYAEYPDGPVYPIIQAHAAALKARG